VDKDRLMCQLVNVRQVRLDVRVRSRVRQTFVVRSRSFGVRSDTCRRRGVYLLTHSTTRHQMFSVGTLNILGSKRTFGLRKKSKRSNFQLTLKIIWGATL
jgi:hypothetical protein